MGNRGSSFLLLFVFSLLGFSFWKSSAEDNQAPNFLIISIDTLRKDRLASYGSVTPNSPRLDEFAKKSVVFDNYYSSANCTIPSHLSMFSSKLPVTLKILDNEKYDVRTRTKILPAYLRQLGYKNYGIASAFFFRKNWLTNFGNAFDHFEAPNEIEFKAEEVATRFQKLIPELKKQKFFCWLHFYDPHSPYDPPVQYKKHYESMEKRSRVVPTIDKAAFNAWLRPLHLEETWDVRAQYRGEVAYTDAQIGVILDLVKQNSLEKNTIIMIVADHGESLGERGLFYTHAGLYEPTIHVPFIAYGKNFKPGHVSQFVSGVDITPTILELAGGERVDDFEGLSSVPLLMGKKPIMDRLIYSISAEGKSIAVFKPPYKLVYNKSADEFPASMELYQVLEDRYERRDLIGENSKVLEEILRRSNPEILNSTEIPTKDIPISEEDLAKLRSLGYIQ